MKTQSKQRPGSSLQDLDVCTSDPAWAEHARPNNDGPEPCDDGRGIQFESDSKRKKIDAFSGV
jgi:hypothetical protein